MKKYIVLIMLLSIPVLADVDFSKQIVGKWRYEIQTDNGVYEFSEDKFTVTSNIYGFFGVYGYRIDNDTLHVMRLDTNMEIETFKIIHMSNDVLVLMNETKNIKLTNLDR